MRLIIHDGRAFLACAFCFLAGCGVRYDESAVRTRPVKDCVAERDAVGLSRHFRLAPDTGREHRQRNMAGDPRAEPTPRDLREARGFIYSQIDLLSVDGPIAYRSDGSASDPRSAEFVAARSALTIDYVADDGLNMFDGQPHPLLVAIYHLKNKNDLTRTLRREDGVRVLLNGEEFSDTVMGVERFSIYPGETGQLVFDRPDDGRFVVIAAGYGDGRTFVGEYPLGEYERDGDNIFSRKKRMFRPLPLRLSIDFKLTTMAAYHNDMVYDQLRGVARLQARQVRKMRLDE